MRISLNTIITASKIRNNDGYGYATERMLHSLKSLNYEVTENDGSSDVGLVFNQPQHARWFGEQYRIMYHPWESTLMMPAWPGIMNNAHEVWTPSPIIAKWYKEYNEVNVPIHVYEHGVDPEWETKTRKLGDKVRFLHVGGEAHRKGMAETLKAFRAAFNGSADVELTMKLGAPGFNLAHHSNVQTISGKVPFKELVQLHHDRHVFVYPSWGEGFGLNPIQAMATGMPTICTAAWAPYERFLDPNLALDSTLVESPWQQHHPGKLFQPDFDDLVDKLRYIVDNYDECHSFAQETAPKIHREYDWDSLTHETFSKLEKRLCSKN